MKKRAYNDKNTITIDEMKRFLIWFNEMNEKSDYQYGFFEDLYDDYDEEKHFPEQEAYYVEMKMRFKDGDFLRIREWDDGYHMEKLNKEEVRKNFWDFYKFVVERKKW